MAARTRKLLHDVETRMRIKTSQIVNRLEKHIFSDGKLLNSTQVTAALGLLRKTIPDLTAVTAEIGVTQNALSEKPDEQLANEARKRGIPERILMAGIDVSSSTTTKH